jgi:cob(I)alamin adenosyltransferase
MNRKRHPLLDLDDVNACLHAARHLLHTRAGDRCGDTKRRLKAIESAVFDAIGVLARQGLSAEESRHAHLRMIEETRAAYMR